MIPLTLREIADLAGGELADVPDPETVVTGPAVHDSREAVPRTLFVAVAGEHADGHDFAHAAVAAGAVGVLALRPVGVPAVVVADVLAALGRLARAVLDRLTATGGISVVAVTGSSGKTGTKDLLAQVLGRLGPTVAPVGSYNNEIGLPLTVLRAEPDTRALVVEMGARGGGHIAHLCGIAPPRIGVVLNVGTAHLGEFGDRAAIARAKAELVEALPPDGLAVLNADDSLVRGMAERTQARVVTFGSDDRAEVRGESVRLDDAGQPRFTLVTSDGAAPVALRLHGQHQVWNALAVACVARELGMPLGEVAAGLGEARARSRWRMEVTERPDGVTVVNDAYNANPESTRAAIDALVAIARGRRTWAVLGEMRELGEASAAEHAAVGAYAAERGVKRLLVVGEAAVPVREGAVQARSWEREPTLAGDVDAAIALIRDELRPGDAVLVKASRAVGLERLAEALLSEARSEGAG